MEAAHIYLHFNGTCEEAFKFYQSVFGGEFQSLTRFKEAPPESSFPDNEADKILHVALPVGRNSLIMGGDIPGAFLQSSKGTNFYIFLRTESEEETNTIFNELGSGGQIAMPLNHTFWGSYFGMIIDKFGVQWMLSFETPGA